MKELAFVTLSVSDKNLLEQAVQTYERNLPTVEGYLAGRGIPVEVARTCRLGYVSSPTPGLGDDEYVGRLAIPYVTPSGVVDVRYRVVQGNGPKYLSRPGTPARMYGVSNLFTAGRYVGVCEGELDTVVATHIAKIPSVGVPGATNWAKHYPLLFEGFERVYVFADGDQAGREFAKKVASTIEQAVIVQMPQDMDVNQVVQERGPDALRKMAGISE
jgi:DNA primase